MHHEYNNEKCSEYSDKNFKFRITSIQRMCDSTEVHLGSFNGSFY